MRTRISACLAAGLLAISIPGGASAAEKTTISFIASGPVLGVDPVGYEGESSENPLNGQEISLKFQKKVDGEWKTKKAQKRTIEDSLVFGGPTPTFKKGKCRIVARYAGDGTYAATSTTNRYTCKTGGLIYS